MSENEIEMLHQKELSLKEQVNRGWNDFWERRGLTAGLCKADIAPTWYNRAHREEEVPYVFASMLEPEELISRAIARRKNLNQFKK